MGTPIPPPNLATLATKPSWHNRAGRVDRSACLVLTAAQLWRDVHPDDWTYRYPARQPAYAAKGKCDRYAELSLWARDLWTLHKYEPPDPLQGDDRSTKSNALRPRVSEAQVKAQPKPLRAQAAQQNLINNQSKEDFLRYLGPVNPNRSVGFKYYKMLGLDCLWQTNIRIERYVQHYNLKQHFLVCPVCGPRNSELGGMGVPPVIEPSKTDRRGGRVTKSKSLPPGRVTKLYLPLCTPQEYEDAQTAEFWLRTHCHPNRPWPAAAVQLIERYVELFEGQQNAGGRQLRCRQCLGLRYGEVKGIGGFMGGRGSRRAASHRRFAVRQEPHPPAKRIPTEQSLFLSNLPKLLAKPQAAEPMDTRNAGARAACRPGHVIENSSRPATDRGTQARGIDGLSAEDKEKLLLLFAAPLPAFKKLARAKQHAEHDA